MMSATSSNLIVDATTLAKNLGEMVVLDCRFSLADTAAGQKDYNQGHIPGAHYCDLNEHLAGEITKHGGRHPLPQFQQFAQQLQRWGITPQSEVVVYDDQKMAFASRAWWLLNIAGVRKVRLLDGGYQSWIRAGYAQDRRKALDNTLKTLAHPHHDFDLSNCETFNSVSESLLANTMTLIDSREAIRYRGESEPIDHIAGHIPTAQNLPWSDITDDEGFLKPLAFHMRRWQPFVDSTQKTVIYCGSGVTACANLFSASLAGQQLSIYPGSWSDWISHEGAPVGACL